MNKSFGETYIFSPARIIKENVMFEDKTENSFMIPFSFEYVRSFFLIRAWHIQYISPGCF